MNKFLSNKTISELKSDLDRVLDQHRKNMLGVDGIKKVLINSIQGYVAKRYIINPEGIYLYRARINKEKGKHVDYFLHTDQLGAPPKNDTSKGRCNDAGESILYCSNHPVTCLAELRGMTENDFVTIIVYEIKKDKKIDPVSFVGADMLKENDNLLQGIIKDYYGDLKNHTDFEKIKLIDDLISTEFHLSIDREENYNIYNTTIAWRQLCFEKSKSNCLIYPSASSLLKTANFALTPVFANKIMFPTEVHRLKILQINNGGTDFVVSFDNKAILNGFGDINWNPIKPRTEYITHRRSPGNPFKMKSENELS